MAGKRMGHVDLEDVDLYEVQTPSGSPLRLLTEEEADFYNKHKKQYFEQYKLASVSDSNELERILLLEVMVHRWSTWLTQGFDYDEGLVAAEELRRNIKDYCVDEETEILTTRGWMKFFEVRPTDTVLSFDTETKETVWSSLRTIHAMEPSGPLFRFESRDHSSLTTSNHRWFIERAVKDRNLDSTWEWRESSEIDGYCWIPTAAPHGSFEVHHKYSDHFVELVAWWWTEGYADRNYHQGEISQSHVVNEDNVRRIRAALRAECGPPGNLRSGSLWNESRNDDITLFNLSVKFCKIFAEVAPVPEKVVRPEFLASLTKAQLDLFIHVSYLADGTMTSDGYGTMAQRSRARMDSFQIATVLGGYQSNLVATSSDMSSMALSHRNAARPNTSQVKDYRGLVWCPETEYGTWVARRDGKVFITGNSGEIRQCKESLGIDRVSRNKDKGEDVSTYIDKLRTRAKEFGVVRNKQASEAIQLFKEAETLLGLYYRTDEHEREYLRLNKDEIFKWFVDTAIPRMNVIDEEFRRTSQKYWVKEM